MNKKTKKGFTLIELLAVIVILAVIALIVTPIVTGIIKSAKEQADRRSAEGYVKAAENYFASTLLDQTKKDKLGTNIFDELEISSKTATKGNVIVDTDGNVSMSIVIGNKCYSKTSSQTLNEMGVSNDIANCGNSEVALVGTPIGTKVLTAFPELELGTNGCKTLDANKNYTYMGGCYLKGAQSTNYLWYSGFLWRIMGINQDGTVRMITEENVTTIPYNVSGNSNFEGSHADSWLNEYFYNNIRGTDIIVSNNFCQGALTTSSSSRTDCTGGITLNKKVGLVSIDEYNLASGSSSYLKNAQYFCTVSPYSFSSEWSVSSDGDTYGGDVGYARGVRAVINVNSNAIITGGNGTLSSTWTNEVSPYILNENKSTSVTGLLKDKVTSGEYVKFTGIDKTYRVVSIDNNGNTKLMLDEYYQEVAGTNYTGGFGTDNVFTTTSGIGQKLNTSVLDFLIPASDTINRNKLVINYIWYQNNFDYGNSYTVSLNETNPTRTVEATVGLIRIGEMLSGQSYTILTKNGTVSSSYSNAFSYWTMTPYTSASREWGVYNVGNTDGIDVSLARGVRAVVNVNSSITITSGNGTPSSPYEI